MRRRRAAPPDHEHVPADSVDALLGAWSARRPDLGFETVGVLTRLARVRRHLEAEQERVFAAHDLDAPAFALLVTLERLDGAVRAARLAGELGLPTADIEARADGLAAAGLAQRRDEGLELTPAGRELFASVVPAHLANQRRLLLALDPDELELLAGLLRKLLCELEGSRPLDGAPPQLGMTVAPAHLTVELREAVGLPAAAGLLVRAVDRDGAAARAGLRTGDVLLHAGSHALRSIAALRGALADAGGRLRVRVLRGIDEQLDVTVEVAGELPATGSPGRASFAEHVV